MKIDMTKLAGAEGSAVQKKSRPGPYRLVKGAAAFACCLALLGTGMVFRAARAQDSASADEMFDPSLSNPSYTVQQKADATLPDISAGEGPIPVLTMKGGGYSATPDEDGLIRTKTERVNLYSEYVTDWLSANTLEQMSDVGAGSKAYVLKEVWMGKNPLSNNQSDFLVAETDGFENVRFTNNPADPDLSKAEGGYFKPGDDGSYVLCIEDGSVVRLVFGEKEGWSAAGVDVYDYDVTDGGYYLEDDYFHLGRLRDTSGAASEKSTVYIDAVQAGINSEENFTGDGARLAFGADLIGTDLAEESVTGELDTPNIYNYAQQEDTDYTGATLGLMKGVDKDGDPVWADGISAPALFGGDAKGKTAYASKYSLSFTHKGTMQTLSSVESEWGTAAEGLERYGTGFWPLDGSPGFAADGHDIAWGTGDGNMMYHRSGDRAPEMLPSSSDGDSHDFFFGLRWTMDFTLEPGYVGPLNVFGISDDDLWVFAGQLDRDGNLMEDTVVQAVDLGGVHDAAGGWCDLWDVIDRVPSDGEAQDWRLFFFVLERDGAGSELMLSVNLPEAGSAEKRETGTVLVEAANYESVKGAVRTFVLDAGGHGFYKASYEDGREATITDGEPFQVPSGSYVAISGLDMGAPLTVQETGRKNVWYSTGDRYEDGDTAECTVGHTHRVSFLSTMDSGTLTLAAAANGEPEGGYGFTIRLSGMGNREVQAMDGYSSPLGSRFADKDGNMRISLAAGETLTLYGLPDDTEFTVIPDGLQGWHLAEILLDSASAEGTSTKGTVPAYVIYRYEENEAQPLQVSLSQSVSGDWTADGITLEEGALLSYRIRVANPNGSPRTVTVEDVLPEGLEVLESSVSDGTVDGQRILWEASVGAGKTAEFAFTCRVPEGTAEFKNTASVACDDGTVASNTVKASKP